MKTTVYVALFTAFMYVLGLIPAVQLSFIAVPIVLQNMGVFLAGSIIGIWGGVSVLLFLFLVGLGLPLLAGGRGGFEVFFGPTAGYLLGYLAAAFFIGFFVQKFWSNYSYMLAISFNIFGMLIIYAIGIPVYMVMTEISFVPVFLGNLAFIPLDIAKVVMASIIALQFKRYFPLITPVRFDKEEKHNVNKLFKTASATDKFKGVRKNESLHTSKLDKKK